MLNQEQYSNAWDLNDTFSCKYYEMQLKHHREEEYLVKDINCGSPTVIS